MSKLEIGTIDYRLEPAHIDWLNTRTQMIIGMIFLFCLCLVNFLFVGRLSAADNAGPWFPRNLAPCFLLCLRMSDFVLYYGSCLLTALVALEITGRFGNRWGAGCAIWAALIFCVIPQQYFFCFPDARIFRAIGFCILLLALWYVRSVKNKVWTWSLLAITFCLEIFVTQNYQKHFFECISWLFFAADSHSGMRTGSIMLASAYFIAALIFLTRLLLGTMSYKAFESIVLCLLVAIAAANFRICEYFTYPWAIFIDGGIRPLLAPAALAIVTGLCCMPAIDNARVDISRIIGVAGVATLIMLAVNLEILFTSWAPSVDIFQ